MRKNILIILLLLLFSSCSNKEPKELILSTNAWIGYAPLFYAQERGYLQEQRIKLITSVSLAESANVFLVSKADLLTLTQHEYNLLKNQITSLTPIILIDRSNGGDMILSNRDLDVLHLEEKIDVYLEVDSINKELIESFITTHALDISKLNFINKDQAKIQNLAYKHSPATLVVTYAPYNLALTKKGFKEIASTSSDKNLLVIDAIATSKATYERYPQRLIALKKIIDRSIKEIASDTKTAHKLTKKYLGNITHKEFEEALESIEWINFPDEQLLKRLQDIGYTKEELIL